MQVRPASSATHLAVSLDMVRDDDELRAFVRANRLIETTLVVVARLLVGATFLVRPCLTDDDSRNVIVRVLWILDDLHIRQHRRNAASATIGLDGAWLKAILRGPCTVC